MNLLVCEMDKNVAFRQPPHGRVHNCEAQGKEGQKVDLGRSLKGNL